MAEGKRLIASTGQSVATMGKIGTPVEIMENAPFLAERNQIFQGFYDSQQQLIAGMPNEPISITLPDGTVKEGISWKTTAGQIAQGISRGLFDNAVVAKVKYSKRIGDMNQTVTNAEDEDDHAPEIEPGFELVDLNRPLEGDCELQILNFDAPEGKITFWHSSAHILGQSLENKFGAHLCFGPPIEPGFFYDAYYGDFHITPDHLKVIENEMKQVSRKKQEFQRVVLNKQQALELFAYNPFKVQLITNKIPDDGMTTAYRCGNLIDLCTGPHVLHTGRIKMMKVTKHSSSYWLAKAENDSLQRVYGVSYPDKKSLDEYLFFMAEAAKRDHRKIGADQSLYFWHQNSPGSTFWMPHGAHIYNKLCEWIREQYRARGFQEVMSPNIYNVELWKTSGHYQNYEDCMFMFDCEGQQFGMKPMNCPGHCLIFDHTNRSYKELPIRMADFGVLHRNELSGTLTGLTRVRRFCQDDAHIFCRPDQIKDEIMGCLDFLTYIYDSLGYECEFALSTMPKKALGTREMWDWAEGELTQALNSFGKPWTFNPEDGAFYGPKIDITLLDALKRKHQCGTIQLDFNLPARFNLSYRTEDMKESTRPLMKYEGFEETPLKPGYERPVMIHRAVLGSLERQIAVLTEHCAGNWPFWLSPKQAVVIAISDKFQEYAELISLRLRREGFMVDLDESNETMRKKIRNAGVHHYNYVLVVGEEEVKAGTVDCRDRVADKSIGKFTIDELISKFESLSPIKSRVEQELDARCGCHDEIVVKEKFSLKEEDSLLEMQTFMGGEEVGEKDHKIFGAMANAPDQDRFPHLHRWYLHMQSL